MSQAATAHDQPRQGRTVAEWTTFGVAAALLLTLIGLVIYDWVVTPPTPPILTARQSGQIEQMNGQFHVPFEVTNTGGETADAVQVIAELTRDGEVVEDGEQQIDFLSGGESEEGAFLFKHDPREGELTLRVGSYKLP